MLFWRRPGALQRKVQSTISKDLKTKSSTLNDDENRYMPKVSLLRPDGSSLTDIYSSKRADVWAKIMKAQLAEEVGVPGNCDDVMLWVDPMMLLLL